MIKIDILQLADCNRRSSVVSREHLSIFCDICFASKPIDICELFLGSSFSSRDIMVFPLNFPDCGNYKVWVLFVSIYNYEKRTEKFAIQTSFLKLQTLYSKSRLLFDSSEAFSTNSLLSEIFVDLEKFD